MTDIDLVARLRKRRDHYNRRAGIMSRFADGLAAGDPYRATADGDTDAEHVLGALMEEAAAEIEEARALIAESIGLVTEGYDDADLFLKKGRAFLARAAQMDGEG